MLSSSKRRIYHNSFANMRQVRKHLKQDNDRVLSNLAFSIEKKLQLLLICGEASPII